MKKLLYIISVASALFFGITYSSFTQNNKNILKEEKALEPFEKIVVSGDINLFIIPSKEYLMITEYKEDRVVISEKKGDTLFLNSKGKNKLVFWRMRKERFLPKVTLYIPSFSDLDASGSTDVFVESFVKDYKLNLVNIIASSASDIEISHIETSALQLQASSSSDVTIASLITETFTLTQSSASDVSLDYLLANEVLIKTNSASDTYIKNIFTDNIKIDSSGASDVNIKKLIAKNNDFNASSAADVSIKRKGDYVEAERIAQKTLINSLY